MLIFGDDLDDETRYLLQRGKTLVQILKQPQYRPMSIKKQIILLNAGMKGYFDFISNENQDFLPFEENLLKFLTSSNIFSVQDSYLDTNIIYDNLFDIMIINKKYIEKYEDINI